MRRSPFRVLGVVCLLTAVFAADAQAQWGTPLKGRFVVHANGLAQNAGGDVELSGSAAFDLYDERATVERRQKIEGLGGGLLDLGASYLVTKNFGFGVSYTSELKNTGTATLSGALPDPEVFDRHRSATPLLVGSLGRRESGVHVSAVVSIPFVERVDFGISFGPSFMTVEQDFVQTPTLSNFSDPLQSSVSVVSASVDSRSKSVTGFNFGGEATYMLTRNIGVGAVLRYVRAEATFDVEGESVSLKAGNAQIGAGLRLKF